MLAISERQRRESLKDAASPLQIMVKCTAKRMHPGDDNIVRNIETSRGDSSWSNDKTGVILCSGVISIPSIILLEFAAAPHRVAIRVAVNELANGLI